MGGAVAASGVAGALVGAAGAMSDGRAAGAGSGEGEADEAGGASCA